MKKIKQPRCKKCKKFVAPFYEGSNYRPEDYPLACFRCATICDCPCGCGCAEHKDHSCRIYIRGMCISCHEGRHETPPARWVPKLLRQHKALVAHYEMVLRMNRRAKNKRRLCPGCGDSTRTMIVKEKEYRYRKDNEKPDEVKEKGFNRYWHKWCAAKDSGFKS